LLIARGAVIGVALDAWMLKPGFVIGKTQGSEVPLDAVADHIDHICQLAGNALLTGLMESLHGRLQWVYRQSVETRAVDSWAEHRELADAILAGDTEAAGRAARTHVLAARASALARATLPA